MTASTPNPAWPLPSDAENAGQPRGGCIHCLDNHKSALQPTLRERAFDAAQRLVLSQPHMAIGQLEQNRLATYILDLAARFEAWMAEPKHEMSPDVRDTLWWKLSPGRPMDSFAVHPADIDAEHADIPDEAEALEAADPVIDAYIESDKRVMAMMQKLKPMDLKPAFDAMAAVSKQIDEIVAAANNANRRRIW